VFAAAVRWEGDLVTTESRRDRQRAATEAEIKAVARRQLVASDGTELSLRGIAREMGMTAPGLYRYFDNLNALAEAMCHDYLDEAHGLIRAALDAAGPDLDLRMHVAIRAFRNWAVAHPAEFGLIFRSKGPGPVAFPGQRDQWPEDCSHSGDFARVFLDLFVDMWTQRPFELPDDEHLPREVIAQMGSLRELMTVEVPDGAVWVFAHAWVRLYSVIALEVLGQLGFMFGDVEPYFEAELHAVAHTVGADYVPRET
jgi:AcrR family transcriptional regulator